LFETFAGQLDDRRLFFAGLAAAAFAPHAQAGAEIGLGQALRLQVREEGLEPFDTRGSLTRSVGQVLLVALDLQLGDTGDGSVGADVPHEAVDLAGCEFPLARWKLAEILRGDLAERFRVRILYGDTSKRSY
jgi:hypothetical protein